WRAIRIRRVFRDGIMPTSDYAPLCAPCYKGMLETMKILNLGAGGFIGSHLTQRLLTEGHTVTAVDLWSDKHEESLPHPSLTFIQQDIRIVDWKLDALVAGADLVIDLIGYANPGLYITIA